MNRAIGLRVFTGCETHSAHVAELAGYGPSGRSQAKQECARHGGHDVRLELGNLLGGFGPRHTQTLSCAISLRLLTFESDAICLGRQLWTFLPACRRSPTPTRMQARAAWR